MSTDAHTYHNLKPLNSGHGQVKSSLLKLIRREPEVVSEVINEHRGHDDDHTPPTVTDRISSVLRQALATIAIFGVFFVIVNWGAISQIVSWEYEKVTTNADTTNPLYGLLDTKAAKEDLLPLTKSAADAKNQIPALALSVAPPDTRLIIPRINRNVPVINVSTESLLKKDWAQLEKDMQQALQFGVIHYPGTARPGQQGNIVVTGHSSYFPWDPGRFKDVFAVLHDVRKGDQILLYNNQKRYIYEVSEIKKVWPSDLDVLQPSTDNKLTLITCTPVGTNLKRLIVEAKLVKVES